MVEGIKKKILDFLTSNKGKEFTVEEIAKAVGEERLNVVKAQLTRLIKDGKVVKTDNKYRAA
ncbi:MAG: TrmB family transcriptional regulator [Vulcanisaeta sp.]|jgi:predicted transcriptional regulator|nr:TrmB family transcriptional regulator [Vulcanisaeta sp.]MCG2870129.1 TrmB family transcriptional regulator [Vulcanisaeta sp.]MCG2880339.1 TrmB family transcriptional regulator [Vulcanisaeta sp.]MCG2887233.1 TrmB family transcriptional regulator [Vulcanisaeta sp.]MCG2895704.1 TrmB family transcriptional regulator [Vulcanisaeta sp.]